MTQVDLYDTTLRDGMQGQGMSLTAAEKVRVVRALDELGEPGEVTRVVQAKFEDALHGRAPEYSHWLDPVEQTTKVAT